MEVNQELIPKDLSRDTTLPPKDKESQDQEKSGQEQT